MLQLNDAKILTVWDWCTEAYLRYGQKLTFPKNTIPNETYQWRFIRAITIKFIDWEFDDDTSKFFINIAVAYAQKQGLLKKGLAVLHQNNIMKICYDQLQNELKNSQQTTLTLQSMKKWFDTQIKSPTQTPIQILLNKSNPRAYCNLTLWHQASKISIGFVSLSKMCNKALDQFSEFERKLFPKITELYLIRSKLFSNQNNLEQLKEIFKEDLNRSCLQPR